MAYETFNAYCDVNDMVNALSQAGLDLRNDDNPPIIWGNAIMRASAKVDQYLFRQYPDAVLLANNLWVRFRCAAIAVYYLCGRRGNNRPASVVADYKEAIEDLKEIKNGSADIPRMGRGRQAAPVASNTRVLLSPQPHVRVASISAYGLGGTATAYSPAFDWSKMTETWRTFPMG